MAAKGASGALSTETAAQLTVMSVLSPELPEPALVESKVAWLDTVPQVSLSVALVMWTLTEPVKAASSSGPQLRVWAVVAVPVTAQLEAVVVAVATCNGKPEAGGASA